MISNMLSSQTKRECSL